MIFVCKKKRYGTEMDAKLALAEIALKENRGSKKVRGEVGYYFCKKCNCYHLTKRKKSR
jgi:hypothetical protein